MSDDFFEAIGLPLQSGRAFSRLDHADAAPSAIVSRDLAQLVWPDGPAEGKQLRMLLPDSELPWNEGVTDDWLTIGGVADDYMWFDQLDQQMKPSQAIYVSLSQQPRRMMFLIAQTQGPPLGQANAIRNVMAQVDPQQPVTFVRTYDDVAQAGFETRRVLTLLLTTFAAMSVLLALVGTYGLVAYQVSQRTREFGIRLVLGAGPAGLLRLVLGHARRLSLWGIALGVLLSLVMTRSVRTELYGVGTVDVKTYVAVSVLLLTIVVVAAWVPARRAMTMEPVVALGDE